MAINETSVDGKKYRQKTESGWKWYSFITKAKDILFGDGEDADNNLETNLGSFKGITTSTNVTETGYASDATVVSDLNRSLGMDLAVVDGKPMWKERGADTFNPFSGGKLYKLGTGRSFNIATIVGSENVGKYTKDNFIAVPTGSSVNCSPMQTVGSQDNPSATATLSSGSVTYDASTGTVTVSGFVLTAIQYCYQYGSGEMGRKTTNAPVTVYFLGSSEIVNV